MVAGLLLDRNPRDQPAVNHQIGAVADRVETQKERAGLQPGDVGGAQALGDRAMHRADVPLAVNRPEDVRVVVAEDRVGLRFARPSHDAGRVRPLGHQIADQHHAVVGRAAGGRQQRQQLVEAAVNVTDDQRAHARHAPRRSYDSETETLTILTGVFGRSPPSRGVFEILSTTSIPSITLPNTGCLEGPAENQSR